ncbi:MAG: antibiotic biosynthesis monooxygenase [Proteobacteria bacterium]|nr:antibiotic biosynthesis monooxygenase [Pseudomonadota bacterium]
MFVVIFRARMAQPDAAYAEMAALLRALALETFGCLEFHALTEGDEEIALSYWPDLASIKAWKVQAEHLHAQNSGRDLWYDLYRVEIAEVSHAYAWTEARQ